MNIPLNLFILSSLYLSNEKLNYYYISLVSIMSYPFITVKKRIEC